MNWRLVAVLALVGIGIGVAQVLGLTVGVEGQVLLVYVIVGVVAIAWREPTRAFRHGFATGMISGIVTAFVQATFFSAYSANNPFMARQLTNLPLGLGPATFIMLTSPIAGLAQGLLLGLLSGACGWVVTRVRPGRSTA